MTTWWYKRMENLTVGICLVFDHSKDNAWSCNRLVPPARLIKTALGLLSILSSYIRVCFSGLPWSTSNRPSSDRSPMTRCCCCQVITVITHVISLDMAERLSSNYVSARDKSIDKTLLTGWNSSWRDFHFRFSLSAQIVLSSQAHRPA